MATRWLISGGGNFSSTSVWNDGSTLGIPTTGDDVFTNGFTVNMDVNATVNSLNNSARARDIATPQMTANNAPSPYVAAASSVQSGSDAFRAFDRVTAGGSYWQASSNTTGWLSMDFGASVIIDAYTIFGSDNQLTNPRNWTFEGSTNNTTWVQLHSVTLGAGIASNSSYSSGSISNPTAYRYYRVNVTLNGGSVNLLRISELELYQPGTAALAAGGSFNFNTAGVSVNVTSLGQSVTNTLCQITAATGTVSITSTNAVSAGSIRTFIHTGNCNFNVTAPRFTGGTASTVVCIEKSSAGTITITGDIFGSASNNVNSGHGISSSNGNTVVIGNVFGGSAPSGTTCHGINQTAGNVTVTGNVVGGTQTSFHGISLTGAASQFTINGNVTGGSGAGAHGINFGGTLGTVNGNVTGGGGATAHGVSATTGGVNVTGTITGNIGSGIAIAANSTIIGNVFAGSVAAGISRGNSDNSFTVTVTGDVYASNTQVGIGLTGTGTQVVNLTGNMYNSLGRMAIWCPNVFISNTATTLWRVDTGGGDYKFLYSADTTPNLPPITDVRFGTTYGPALSLTGTMVVPTASDVRENVAVDNTVGTGELTSADIISGINASADPLAVRLKNALTDVTAGNIISQYKDS